MEEFVLYALRFRSRAERVLWTLRELDLPHRVVRLDPLRGETSTPEFRRLNPSGKVPVLVRGDEVFTESLAIMEYLNAISDAPKLIPADPAAMYRFRRVIHYAETEIEPYLWIAEQATRLRRIYTWPEGTADESIDRVRKAMPTVFEWLVDDRFIAGAEFTLADIYYYQIITWAQKFGIEAPAEAESYLERLARRPHFPEDMRTSS